MGSSFIRVRGARTHNLKNISLDIPRNKFCVFTGISGSGKSSLIMHTIFRESQRRYLNSLPSYARKFVHSVVRPDVDSITGLSPSICISQKVSSHDPRSTVGTVTEIYSFLRLLYSRLGEMYCPQGHGRIAGGHLETLIVDLLERFTGKNICILSPVVSSRKGRHQEILDRYSTMGFSRARINQKLVRIDAKDLKLDRYKQNTIEIVVDTVEVSTKQRARIEESCKKALQLSGDSVCVGILSEVDVITDNLFFTVSRTCSRCFFSVIELEPRQFSFNSNAGACSNCLGLGYTLIEEGGERVESCVVCFGSRLNEIALSVFFRGKNIYEMCCISVEELYKEFQNITLSEEERLIGESIVEEIRTRLGFLDQVGLGYLSLDRGMQTLSGGETQRVRLSSKINTSLQGCLYVLDEPSIGLHPRDNHKLIAAMKEIVAKGNTVYVVEHDEQTILSADYLIDVGPDAGCNGGEVLFSGSLQEISTVPVSSWTLKYLLGKKIVDIPPRNTEIQKKKKPIVIKHLSKHNIVNLEITISFYQILVISGVSGSGKSSLVEAVYEKYIDKEINWTGKIIKIDQSPIGRTPRSNPSTYTGMMNIIRDFYADLRESRLRGYGKSRFSFNLSGGRCDLCEGSGVKKSDTDFFTYDEIHCEFCNGMRFNPQTLEVRYKGKNIGEVLEMTVDEAMKFFVAPQRLLHILKTMQDIGLGYIRLGQSSMSLSGGESQRIKLVYELVKDRNKETLYLLDEPTTGLHFEDVQNLMQCIRVLTDQGHAVVVIEHDLDVIGCADTVIEMGPEGGERGGQIIFEGSPKELITKDTPTGIELAKHKLRIEDKKKGNFNFLSKESNTESYISTLEDSSIVIKGLQQNNLKNITVTIPKKKIIVITGPSGSGKSSLAYETLYLEGQRRYVETLPTYVRRFIGNIPKSKVETITGLLPTIVVQQKGLVFNTRSTVATQTELYDSLRVIYANAGVPGCKICKKSMVRSSPEEVLKDLLKKYEEKLISVYAPVYRKNLDIKLLLDSPEWLVEYSQQLMREGQTRIYIDDNLYEIDSSEYREKIELFETISSIDFYIDRMIVKESETDRLKQAIESSYQTSGGYVSIIEDTRESQLYTSYFSCIEHGEFLTKRPAPKDFLFNHPAGACKSCNGLGFESVLNCSYFLRDESKTLFSGAVAKEMTSFLNSPNARYGMLLRRVLRILGGAQAIYQTFSSFTKEERGYLLYGFCMLPEKLQKNAKYTSKWIGLEQVVLNLIVEGKIPDGKLLVKKECSQCLGDRVNEEVQRFTLRGLHIGKLSRLSVQEALREIGIWKEERIFSSSDQKMLENPLADLYSRLKTLLQLGLGYMELSRGMSTLSTGETQKIRLAAQLSNNLTNTLYILDEPTVGLHPSDIQNVFESIEGLKEDGNTIVVVDHNPILIEQCDFEISLGPKSGVQGGEITYIGIPQKIYAVESNCIREKKKIDENKRIIFNDINARNVQIPQINLPTECLVGISGKSGAGKTTLLKDLLNRIRGDLKGYSSYFEDVVSLDQETVSLNRRSLVISFLEIFTFIRLLFSQTKESRIRGYTPNMYSFNSAHGACEKCRGNGEILVEMHFLPDVTERCTQCDGMRYKKEVLEIFFQEKNIFDILNMSIDDAFIFFEKYRQITDRLDLAKQLGLGYSFLGTKIDSLSGGELQRLNLIRRLGGKQSREQKVLYIFDEPLSQLHRQEVELLIQFWNRLIEKGDTVWVIENNITFLRNCDYIIDIGPDAGLGGGKIVSEGTIEKIKSEQKGTTWKYL